RFLAVGTDTEVMPYKGAATQVIDVGGRTVIPGLNDSHLHLIRGGLNYNLELRWDGVPSLADALRMLREQAQRTPPNHWVRVVGGWSEFQFAEKRMPTLAELNAAAPDTPVFVLNLYATALLNRAALRAAGYTRDTPNPPSAPSKNSRISRTGRVPSKRGRATTCIASTARARCSPIQLRTSKIFSSRVQTCRRTWKAI